MSYLCHHCSMNALIGIVVGWLVVAAISAVFILSAGQVPEWLSYLLLPLWIAVAITVARRRRLQPDPQPKR